jgi:hypothetical protein
MTKNSKLKRLQSGLETKYDQKTFLLSWFRGITKTMSAVYLAEQTIKPGQKEPPKPARIASRGDFSKANPKEARANLLKDKDLCFGNKGFYGTPLPLIPDIRTSEVNEGVVGTLLEAFGIVKKFGRIVTLYQGPNRRSNRYLVFQYNRLIKTIDGAPCRGTVDTLAHIT